MAKKKPTSKSIRQGQTVYYVTSKQVYAHINNYNIKLIPVMMKTFLHSHNVELPGPDTDIIKVPVGFMKSLLACGNKDFFYSRNKATKRFDLLKEDMRKRGVLSAEFY